MFVRACLPKDGVANYFIANWPKAPLLERRGEWILRHFVRKKGELEALTFTYSPSSVYFSKDWDFKTLRLRLWRSHLPSTEGRSFSCFVTSSLPSPQGGPALPSGGWFYEAQHNKIVSRSRRTTPKQFSILNAYRHFTRTDDRIKNIEIQKFSTLDGLFILYSFSYRLCLLPFGYNVITSLPLIEPFPQTKKSPTDLCKSYWWLLAYKAVGTPLFKIGPILLYFLS